MTLSNGSATTAVGSVIIASQTSPALDIANAHWHCNGAPGDCTTADTQGPLLDSANVAANAAQTWILTVPVLQDATDATATIRIASPGAAAASDIDTLVIFRGTFEGP